MGLRHGGGNLKKRSNRIIQRRGKMLILYIAVGIALCMKLVIRKKDKLALIFRVDFYKSQHNSVIGESALFDILQAQIPEGTGFHSHFIYVETGNYHYSIKYYDTVQHVYVDRKTYHNHIAIRKGSSPNFTNEQFERRDKNPDEMLDSLMMEEPLKPWTHRPLGHQFGNTAFNLDDRNQRHLNWVDDLVIKADDLVIDIEETTGKVLNLHSAIFSTENEAFDYSKLPDTVAYRFKEIVKGDLILRIGVIIA